MRVLIWLFLAAFFFTAFARAEETKSENEIQRLKDKAWALSNIGEEEKAEQIYQQLLQEPNVPFDVYFSYIDILIAKQHYKEAMQYLSLAASQQKFQNKEFSILHAFKQAEILLAYRKYQKAFDSIKDYKNMPGNRIYAAYFSLMAGKLDETAALLDKVVENVEYTPHEQQKAEWLRMDMKRFWSPQVSTKMKFINNKLYGTLHPIESEVMFPLNNWGRVKLQHYYLNGKDQLALNIAKVVGFKDKLHFSVLSSDNQLGFKTGWQQRRLGFYQFGFKGFYRDIETDVTALVKNFALKSGGEISGYYKLGRKITIGGSYIYNDYQLPDSGEDIGYMHIIHPYFLYSINDKIPGLQHGIGWVHIQGEGNLDFIVSRFDMPYYVISGLHHFGPYKNLFNYSLTIGYMRGENFEGLAANPKGGLRYSLGRDLDFLAGLEYRIDSLSGDGETRGDVGINWRFK